MNFLHLSDLHIGKSVNGFSMTAEQKHALNQIIGYVRTERIDAAVIAGDIYDRAVPGADAVRVFDDFLTELAGENIAVILISGNHDSPERLNYASRLLSDKRIYLYGAFDGSLHKIILPDEHGDVNFWLMPFIKPDSYNEAADYDGVVKAVIESADIDYAARNVIVSHQFYTKAGVSLTRSDSELNAVGGLDAVDAQIIGRFDYAALGHLHGGQNVGDEHIRYCGSPIKYSFSEWRQRKSVTLVEMGAKGRLTVKTLPLTPIHNMREIRGDIDTLINADKQCAADKNDYLRVILTNEEEIIDPMGKLRAVYPNIMSLDFENSRTRVDVGGFTADTATEKLSAYELFCEFFLNTQGATMSAEQSEIVLELLKRGDEE